MPLNLESTLQLNKFATIIYNNSHKFHRALFQQSCIEYQLMETLNAQLIASMNGISLLTNRQLLPTKNILIFK